MRFDTRRGLRHLACEIGRVKVDRAFEELERAYAAPNLNSRSLTEKPGGPNRDLFILLVLSLLLGALLTALVLWLTVRLALTVTREGDGDVVVVNGERP
jgi:hypothetical protein